MTIVALTFAGEKITFMNTTIPGAIERLREGGVSEDWIYKLEVIK